jgi:hypothetical protein
LRRSTVGLLAILVCMVAPGATLASSDQVKLALLPVGQPGAFFDLTMKPGERRTFEVQIGDDSSVPLAVRTYAADVYTIVNGGFGGRLRDEPPSGMTTWLHYPSEVIPLDAGERVRRSFTIQVPKDAAPGEHIASLVLENDLPIRGTGSVALDQIVRQAVAVVVTVPGRRLPALEIGAASHVVVAGRSVVSIAVANAGNVRLKPAIGFTLVDATGVVVSRAQMQMDTFYAWTATTIEVPLAALLLPGAYRVHLTLEDAAQGAEADAAAIPLVVVAPPAGVPGEDSSPGLVAVNQGSLPGLADAGGVPWAIVGIVGLLGILAAAVIGLGVRRVRGRRNPDVIDR